MSLRISHIDNPIRLLLDTPYVDGIKNIKAALQLEKISRIAEREIGDQYSINHLERNFRMAERRIIEKCSATRLGNRCIQFIVGGSLLIPGINIIIDLVMRLLNDANWYGNYFPDSEVRYPNDLDELISEKARMDGIISERILPHFLEFLEVNGYPEASVKYKVGDENLKFNVHFRENADLSINIPYPIEPVRSTLPLYRPGETTERGIFAELKKKAIFYHRGLEERGYLHEFISHPFRTETFNTINFPSFNNWMQSNITPNILQMMRSIGLENPQFTYEARQREGDRIDEFDVDVKLISNNDEFARFSERIIGWLISSPPLFLKEIIHQIVMNKKSL